MSTEDLALFPLHAVLMPGGRLTLKVFEARYLDLMSRCLRTGAPFGVITLREGGEVRTPGETVTLENVGCLAEIVECDAPGPGRLQLLCRGTRRFRLSAPPQAGADGLWSAPADILAEEPATAIPEALERVARALEEALKQLAEQGVTIGFEPHRFDDAVWVGHRWCELLPLSTPSRVALMALDDPIARLQTVDHLLHERAQSAPEEPSDDGSAPPTRWH